MDWSGCHEVEQVPGKVSGAWVVKNSRIPADALVANALDGFTPEQIATDLFEGLTAAQVQAVLDYARAYEAHPA